MQTSRTILARLLIGTDAIKTKRRNRLTTELFDQSLLEARERSLGRLIALQRGENLGKER